jgi:putative aminopeptidase FrvX
VVGGVQPDGYLTLRRAAGRGSPALDAQLQGQRITIQGRRGPVTGVVGVRSIHLTRSREAPAASTFTVDSAWVDLGAASASEVGALGVGLLSPLTLTKRPQRYGRDLLAAPSAGRRAACAALLAAVRRATAEQGMVPGSGSVVVAFTVEQELSQRGLATLSNTLGPFSETVLVDGKPGPPGGLLRDAGAESAERWPRLGTVTRWAVPVRYPGTPVETVALSDAAVLRDSLVRWIRGER